MCNCWNYDTGRIIYHLSDNCEKYHNNEMLLALFLGTEDLSYYGAMKRPRNGIRPRTMLTMLVRTNVATAESTIVTGVGK